jgi:hypothetical protein
MIKPSRVSIFAGGFILSLFLSFGGCATNQLGAAPGSHPENYRKVYFVSQISDPRKVAPRVVDRLKQTGFDVTSVTTNKFSLEGTGTVFELSRWGHLSIHHTNVAREKIEPSLVCFLSYVSMTDDWETWWSFQHIQIAFLDSQTGDLVYLAKKFESDPPVPENGQLNRLFLKIFNDFFPGQPNPFKQRK